MAVSTFPASLRAHGNAAAESKGDGQGGEEKREFFVHAVF